MQLSNEFVQGMMAVLTNPAAQIDVALILFFPEVQERQHAFNHQRIQSANKAVNAAAMYDFLQKEFPAAPDRESVPQFGPDILFREMLKHIIAKAFNYEYKTAGLIVTH